MIMDNVAITLLSAVVSGVLATIITLLWQNRSEKIRARREIFQTLMAYRFKYTLTESVKALNCVQAVFFDCQDVLKAWDKFNTAAAKKPVNGQDIDDAYILILEEIAKVLHYKNINWKDIKISYFPSGLAEELTEQAVLRKAQIEAARGVRTGDIN